MVLSNLLKPISLLLTIYLIHCGQGLALDTEPVLNLVDESKPSVHSNGSNSFTTSPTGTNSFGSTGGNTSGSTGTNSSGATGSPVSGATGSPPGNPFR
ncbi:MAG: hypothetical protein JJT78_12310 [Leptospira sp.]|nr:hypothetical protein [Leptospira sp.]